MIDCFGWEYLVDGVSTRMESGDGYGSKYLHSRLWVLSLHVYKIEWIEKNGMTEIKAVG